MDEQKVSFGRRLKAFRAEHQMSQEEVADRTERSVHAISQIERGINAPSIETCLALADLFHVTLDDLIGRRWRKVRSGDRRSQLEGEIGQQIAAMSVNELEALKLAIRALKHGR